MEPSELKALEDGEEEAYVLFWPPFEELEDYKAAVVSIVMKRPGGFLVAVPASFLEPEDLAAHYEVEGGELLGPYSAMAIPGVSLKPEGPIPTGGDIDVLVVDLANDASRGMYKLVDAGLSEEQLVYFTEDTSVAPDSDSLLKACRAWISHQSSDRVLYYSAEEEMVPDQAVQEAKAKGVQKAKAVKPKRQTQASIVAEQIGNIASLLPALSKELAVVKEEQKKLVDEVRGQASRPIPRPSQLPVSMPAADFAKMLGSPPRVEQTGPLMSPPPKRSNAPCMDSTMTLQEQAEETYQGADPLALAMLEQSRALTSLVAHFQTGDPLLDGTASGAGTSSRGSQGREKLQKELSSRTGGFFLAVMQNMFRRLKPAVAVPQSLEGLAETDVSMVQYLERFGGYGNSRDMGIVQYGLSYIADLALRGDLQGVQEHLALLLVGIEQYVQDGNRWDLGFQLTLLEDPPSQMWSYRNPVGAQTGRTRAFSGLCPQRWATIALAYAKEMDFIQSRRQEIGKRTSPAPAAAPTSPSPKRKGKGKKGADAPQEEGA